MEEWSVRGCERASAMASLQGERSEIVRGVGGIRVAGLLAGGNLEADEDMIGSAGGARGLGILETRDYAQGGGSSGIGNVDRGHGSSLLGGSLKVLLAWTVV